MSSRPTLRIDTSSPVPVYRQVANSLRAFLVDGRFQPGDQLPTVRQVAVDLGVHHNTVAEAYRILADEGWLDMRRHHGVRVLDRSHPKASPDQRASFLRQLRELIAEARSAGLQPSVIAQAMRTMTEQLAGSGKES